MFGSTVDEICAVTQRIHKIQGVDYDVYLVGQSSSPLSYISQATLHGSVSKKEPIIGLMQYFVKSLIYEFEVGASPASSHQP